MTFNPAFAQLRELHGKLENYIDGNYREEGEDSENKRTEMESEKRKKRYFLGILSDICNVIRPVTAAPDYQDILLQADRLVNKAVEDNTKSEEEPYLQSFAHTDAHPEVVVSESENLEDMFGYGHLEGLLPIIQSLYEAQGVSPDIAAANVAFKRSPPWAESPQPHPYMSRLARFKPNVITSVTPATQSAALIYHARCEITSDSICNPVRAQISPGGACLAISSAGGWKGNLPVLQYYLLDDDSGFPMHHIIETGLEEPSRELAFDEQRKLVFVADEDRIKSFAWGVPGGDDYLRAMPTHTMDSEPWDGPIALLSGHRFVRAGKGSVGVWNLEMLETHGATGKKPIGETRSGDEEGTFEDDGDDVELSDGSKAMGSIKFEDATLKPATWGAHPCTVGSMICGFSLKEPLGYSCVVVDLEHGGKTVTRYLGHGGEVLEFSTSAVDPFLFATGCGDGYARLFDVRVPLPVMTFNAGRQTEECCAVVLAHPDGVPTLFTGAARAEEVRMWDIRAKATVYELSTGNNAVVSLAWDARHNALYAATECRYMDRMGNWNGYRRAKVPKDQRYTYGHGGGNDRFVEEDEGTDDYSDGRCWPKQAYHGEEHFGYLYDAGEHKIFRYAFKENPDATVLPAYGQASVDRGSEW
ncbi:hypothetical protein FPV67DRAFT_876444 [Lyophyllum atratum]|nr:hypothetical protein FPV67DRAFT_876444 [Lyophyllum atratum]